MVPIVKLPANCFVVLLLLGSFGRFHCKAEDKDDSNEKVIKSEEIKDEIVYIPPKPLGFVYFAEHFDDLALYKSRWVLSNAKKDDTDESIAKYNGEWSVEATLENSLKGNLGLVLKSKAKHHAISAKLFTPFVFDKKPFIVQYEVNFQNGLDCGGAYIKLLTDSKELNLKNFQDKTPYSIMFGPDKCGTDAKLHFIFRHENPRNGTITEKHCKHPSGKIEEFFKDKKSHLYTLVLKPDNSFEILVDSAVVNQGNLLEDFNPPVNPPAEIEDPEDKKPSEWDEREKIVDPDAKKPNDWDEDAPQQIPDPNAVKPEDWLDDEPETKPDPNAVKPSDWDDEMDGEWEAPLINNPKCEKVGCGDWKPPLIDNPNYKGKWYPPMIDNPNYKGKWKPRKIPNPDFYEDKTPFKMSSIGAVGIELWSMTDGIYFDNIVITDDKLVADQWAKDTWELIRKKDEQETEGLISRLVKYTNNHPWLWAVYIVVIGLPLVLIVVFCCSSEEKQEQKRAAKAKKTDLSTPDDEQVNATEEQESEEKIEESGAGDEKRDSKDSQSENEEEEEEETDKKEIEGSTKDEIEDTEEPEEKDESVDDASLVEELSGSELHSGTNGRSPRRRRTRKD